MTQDGFAEAFDVADRIPGWLTREQAHDLYTSASGAVPGTAVVEIGSHLGRSATILASAAPDEVTVVAVDPFPSDWRYGRPDTEGLFRANLASAGLTDRVDVRVRTSAEALRAWDSPISVLYIDGAHDLRSVLQDLRWAEHVRHGGEVWVHDAFSSVGVTLGLLAHVPLSSRLRYAGRTGSLARFVVDAPSTTDRLRMLRETPWWTRNLALKVLLRLRLRGFAARLGHQGTDDPY